MNMNTLPKIIRSRLVLSLACVLFALPRAIAADAGGPIPAVIQAGFKYWAAKNDASYAFDIWKKGGLLDTDAKPAELARYFGRIDHTVGNYKSFETIQSKPIGDSSRIIYLSINFEHAAVYGRFLVYRTDKDWVVQNMDFSPKPEAIMPWLAFTGENYEQ